MVSTAYGSLAPTVVHTRTHAHIHSFNMYVCKQYVPDHSVLHPTPYPTPNYAPTPSLLHPPPTPPPIPPPTTPLLHPYPTPYPTPYPASCVGRYQAGQCSDVPLQGEPEAVESAGEWSTGLQWRWGEHL